MEKSFADEIASSRQDRDDAKKHLDDAQSKYEMHVFAVEVYRQYTLKKQKNKKVVGIYVKEILANGEICTYNGCYLDETRKAIFLNSLDKYFGLRMATLNECTEEGVCKGKILQPHLISSLYFYVTGEKDRK